MRKLLLILYATSCIFANPTQNQLEFVLDNIKKNISSILPIQLNDGGIIDNVKVEGK